MQALFAELADAPAAARADALAHWDALDPAFAADLRGLLEADAEAAGADTLLPRVAGALTSLAADLRVDEGVPAWIGDYRITGVLGAGGMGVVYRAEQESPRRTVALKVIRTMGGASAIRRFQREAELHGRLQHPGIAQIHEAGLAVERDEAGRERGPPRPFFAMELVEGVPITEHARAGALRVDERVELVARVCDAVEHAHSRGVIHRDLKAANVLVDRDGNPKVLDFGIARATDRGQATTLHTAVGEVIGTLPYMSPEQVAGDPAAVGKASDVYALGVLLFEVLSGRRPLDLAGRTIPEAVRIVTDEEPTRLGALDRTLRGDLDTIVARCLEKDPARRYASAGDLAEDLRRHLAHRPIAARPPSTLYQLGKFARRNRPLVAGVCTAFVALVAATALSLWMALEARSARDEMSRQLHAAQVENARSTESFAFLTRLLAAADPRVSQGRETTVRDVLNAAADDLERDAPADSQAQSTEVRGMLARVVGYTLVRLGDLDRGERVLRRSAALLRRTDPNAVTPEYSLTETLNLLGDLLRERNKYAEAAEVLEEIIAIRRQTHERRAAEAGETLPADADPLDTPTAVALNNLSLVHQSTGNFARAEELAARAVRLERALVTAGNASREAPAATASVNLASAQLLAGHTREAEATLRAALAVHERLTGPDAPLTQTVRNNLAAAMRLNGRYEEALALTEKLQAVRARILPPGHFERVRGDANLAQTLGAMGRFREAAERMDAVVEAAARIYGEDSEDVLRWRILLGGWRMCAGDAEGVPDASADLVRRIAALLGPAHIRVAEALAIHAAVLRMAGLSEDACTAAEEAIRVASAAQGPEHPVVLLAGAELARAAPEARGVDEAIALAEANAAASARVRGADHPATGLARLTLAEALWRAGRWSECRAAALEAARVLALPGGTAAWNATYAGALAARAERAGAAPTPEDLAALDRAQDEIISLAGPQAPDLARVRALRTLAVATP